jgi:hypothetical protein
MTERDARSARLATLESGLDGTLAPPHEVLALSCAGGVRLCRTLTADEGGASVASISGNVAEREMLAPLASLRSKVGSTGTLAPPTLLRPADVMHTALVGPIVNAHDQSFANRILLHVEPFLRIALAVAQSMMPAPRLKFPTGVPMLPAKLTFPVGDPFFDGELEVTWRAEAMQVVRHHKIIADQPCRCFQPGLMQQVMNFRVVQPRLTILGGHRQQHPVWPAKLHLNPRSRKLPPDIIKWRSGVHASIGEARLRRAIGVVHLNGRVAAPTWWSETLSNPDWRRRRREQSEHLG